MNLMNMWTAKHLFVLENGEGYELHIKVLDESLNIIFGAAEECVHTAEVGCTRSFIFFLCHS